MDKEIFQLCNSITEEEALKLDENKYIAQEKKDGERCMIFVDNHKAIFLNRRGNIITYKFPEIAEQLGKLDNCILDSEICSQDDNFNSLQKRALLKNPNEIAKRISQIPCVVWIFDILRIENSVLTQKPLRERIRELYSFLDGKETQFIKILPFYSIKDSLKKAHDKEGEGVVIKTLEGLYVGKRSDEYKKCKFFKETTITITGFTDNNAGIRATDNLGNTIQISGHHSDDVKIVMQEKGYAEVFVQYLTISKEGRMRFPSYRGLVLDSEVSK
jgi:bifunctional non-homologous end joining protein LigD